MVYGHMRICAQCFIKFIDDLSDALNGLELIKYLTVDIKLTVPVAVRDPMPVSMILLWFY